MSERVGVVVRGTRCAGEAMGLLLRGSQSFHFMPLPDDRYRLEVWPDVVGMIEHLREKP